MKHKRLSKGVKASVAFFVASLVTSGISYLVTPIYTRMLTSGEYGQTSLFLTWLHIFGIVAMFCLSYGVFNNGMSDYPEKRDEFSFSMLILSNIITCLFFGILLSLYPLICSVVKIDVPMIVLIAVMCFFQPAYNFWATRQRYEYKYKMVVMWSVLCAVISPLTAILLMSFSPSGERLYPRIFGAECALICVYICFYIYIGCKNKWKINTGYWKQALLFNLPLIPHYLSAYLLTSSDKIMISYLIGDSETAYYSVAHAIAAIALIIWSAINASLVPFTYEKCKSNNYKDINKVALPLIFLFSVGCIIVILLAPEVIGLISTNEYLQAIYVIPPIVGGVFFQVLYHIFANLLFYYKKTKYVMVGSFVAVSLNIILNYFCIKKWGYVAAGYTTIICYAAQAIIDAFAMKKVVGEWVYNIKYIVFLSIFIVVVALTSNLIYDYAFVRYGILLVILVIAFIFRKKIINLFSFRRTKHYNEIGNSIFEQNK